MAQPARADLPGELPTARLDAGRHDRRVRPIDSGRERWWLAIVWGGLAAGVLDGTAASLFYGATAQRVFQSVASGLIGRGAFEGGWPAAILGMGLHLVIATLAAASYVLASRRLPWLVRRPWLFGPAFGVAVYYFMQHVVVPLSAAAQGSFSLSRMTKGLLIHVFCVGLPIALCARRWAPNAGAR